MKELHTALELRVGDPWSKARAEVGGRGGGRGQKWVIIVRIIRRLVIYTQSLSLTYTI